jgi:phosphoesterase RecJ-like protein
MMEMPLSILNDLGAVYSDSEGMADHTITVIGVEVGMLLKYSESETHFSLRSKGRIDVGKIAQKVPGGGGHYSAAGCTVKAPRDEALAHMLQIIAQELD